MKEKQNNYGLFEEWKALVEQFYEQSNSEVILNGLARVRTNLDNYFWKNSDKYVYNTS